MELDDSVRMVRLGGATLDGPRVGRHLARSRYLAGLPDGVHLSDIVVTSDLSGTVQLGWWPAWRQAGLGDLLLVPDPATAVVDPDHPGVLDVIGTFCDLDGAPLPVCSRSLLQEQQERLGTLGYEARCAYELEFVVVTDPIEELRRRSFSPLHPLGGPGHTTLSSIHRHREFLPILAGATERLDRMGVAWEAFSDELGPGQFELNLAPSDAVSCADDTVRAKHALRAAAAEHASTVTFMAKPFADYGSGLHLHLSLWRDGEAVFAEVGDELRHWIGGTMATLPAATSIQSPTINSYRRQVEFGGAPTSVTWGVENKTTAVRYVADRGSASRVEHRCASADANPYLVLASILAGGIAGLQHGIEPPAPVDHMGWGLPDRFEKLPGSITEAATALALDEHLRKGLGDAFVDHWVETRQWEWLMFHTGGGDPESETVTDWELDRYFQWV